MKRINRIVVIFALINLALAIALAVDFILTQSINAVACIILAMAFIMLVVLFFSFTNFHKSVADVVENSISSSMNDALKIGEIGILVYNEEYEITWLSAMFNEKHINHVGEKLLVWIPELQDLVSGKVKKLTVVINDDKYLVSKKEDAYVLFFNDISKEYDLEKKVNDKAYVLGLVSFDNFDETNLSEDEIAFVNTNIKVPVLEYFRRFGVVYKTLRNNRLQLILNNEIFQKLLDDRFSILNKVKRESKSGDVDVTLSVSLTYGSDDLCELDEAASALLEIAETRGGDQVAVRELGKDAIFYGGSSEAKERQSKVKVRVVANTLKRMAHDAKNVIIVCHKDADADCIGSAIAMSLIMKRINRDVYIVSKSGGVEPMINDVLAKYGNVLSGRHRFVSEQEALNYLSDESLVIMVDHHSKLTSNSPNLLDKAKKIAIFDHHRRKADLDVNATFLYIEAGASSATELVVELFSYFPRGIDVEAEEANVMYIGLLIDTNHFRNRSDSRTFDVAKTLKQLGASSSECEVLIEEPYAMSIKRYEIIALGRRVLDNFMIADMREVVPRSIASQAADMMVEIKEISSAFVIFQLSKNELAISARSDGSVNVQLIMEKLGGGGHMTAAGLQIKDKDQDELYSELVTAIKEYLESVVEYESNTVE